MQNRKFLGFLIGLGALLVLALGVEGLLQRRSASRSLPASQASEHTNVPEVASHLATIDQERSAIENAQATTAPSRGEALGDLLMLSLGSGLPVPGAKWSLTSHDSDGAVSASIESDGEGRMRLREGEWRLASADDRYVAVTEHVRITEGEQTVAFAQARGQLAFLVTDLRGSPIERTDCWWTPLIMFDIEPSNGVEPTASRSEALHARSNREGRVEFANCPRELGMAVFVAEGFERVTMHLAGGISSPVRVLLPSCTRGGTTLTVQSALDDQPILEAVVEDASGTVVAIGNSSNGQVTLPAWVSTDEQLSIASARTVTGMFRVRDAVAGCIRAYPRCEVTLRHAAALEPLPVARVIFSAPGRKRADGCVLPLMPKPVQLRGADALMQTLPQGLAVRMVAVSSSGLSTAIDRTFDAPSSEVVFDLRPAALHLEITVTDQSREPISKSWARIGTTDGATIPMLANERGVIRVPDDLGATWIEVGAPSRASVGLRYMPNQGEPSTRATRLLVMLDECWDVPIRVVTPENRPLPGLQVRVWRHAGDDVDVLAANLVASAGSAWRLQNPKALRGLTNGSGEFVARRVRPGEIDIEIRLPDEYIAAGNGVSLFLTQRERVHIDGPEPKVVISDKPLCVALRVLEDLTGAPVDSFELVDPDQARRVRVTGSFCQVWLSSGTERLSVSVPALGEMSVAVADLALDRINEIRVGSQQLAELEIQGLPPESLIDRIDLTLFRDRGGQLELLTSVSVELIAGRATLAVPSNMSIAVTVNSLSVGGTKWSFEPAVQAFTPGGSLRYSARAQL